MTLSRPLEITGLSKTFQTGAGPFTAVQGFNARIEPGSFVTLLGHSGCGKSTVLAILAGLQDATEGGFCMDGREVTGTGLERAVVFQSPSLLPWLTALENVLLALTQASPGARRNDARSQALHYLELAGVSDAAGQKPAELSLGTQQRVAIARALSQRPRVLLLDEPLGMLDSLTRFSLQDTLLSIWEKTGQTVIMVTHDVDEALYLSTQMILMTDGPAARVGEVLTIDFPRPRHRASLLRSSEYRSRKARVLAFLEQNARQGAISRAE